MTKDSIDKLIELGKFSDAYKEIQKGNSETIEYQLNLVKYHLSTGNIKLATKINREIPRNEPINETDLINNMRIILNDIICWYSLNEVIAAKEGLDKFYFLMNVHFTDNRLFEVIKNKKYEYYTIRGIVENMQSLLFLKQYNYSEALEHANKGLKYLIEINNELEIARSMTFLARIFNEMGQISLAFEYIVSALNLANDSTNGVIKGIVRRVLGDIYRSRGEYDLALEEYHNSLLVFQDLDNPYELSKLYLNIGIIANAKDDKNLAHDYLEKALEIRQMLDNEDHIIECLFHLSMLSLSQRRLDLWEDYFSQFKDLEPEEKNIQYNYKKLVLEAYFLKSNPLPRYFFDSTEKFEKLLHHNDLPFELRVFTFFNLCDLYIYELEVSPNDTVIFQRIQLLLGYMKKFAQDQKSILLLLYIIIFESKISLINLNLVRSRLLLDQADLYALENGMEFMWIKINEEKEQLNEKILDWERLIKKNASVLERIHKVEIKEYISEVKRLNLTNPI
jgi:tetratricopeptide (TPR) repeat protein